MMEPHWFLTSTDPRYPSCVKCGRVEDDPIHQVWGPCPQCRGTGSVTKSDDSYSTFSLPCGRCQGDGRARLYPEDRPPEHAPPRTDPEVLDPTSLPVTAADVEAGLIDLFESHGVGIHRWKLSILTRNNKVIELEDDE